MKKFVIMSLVLGVLSRVGFGQVLVTSPELSIPINKMAIIQAKLEASKAFSGMVTSLRSVHKFASIVEETRCATEDLRYAISQLEFMRSAYIQRCDFEVRFNVAVYQLSAIPDLINSVINSTNMEGSERLKIMSDTMDKFEKTNKDVVSLTKDLTDQIVLEEVEDKYRIDREWSLRNVF